MNSTHKLHSFCYLTMTLLTLILTAASVAAAVSGTVDIFTGGLGAVVLIIFAILQIACISVYQPAFTPYKVGFYLLHLGLLILLSGLAAFELAGRELTVQVPVNEYGSFYSSIQSESGEETELGFSFRVNAFCADKYESGADRYYRADVEFLDPTTLRQTKDYLEVNRTLRQNNQKIYLMDYSDGFKTLSGQYGLTADSFYESYASGGAESGYELLSLIYQDIAGVRYSYYLYDEANSRFLPRSAEEIALIPSPLWAYTEQADRAVTVYIVPKNISFAHSLTDSGKNVISFVEQTYPDKRVSYYYYTMDQGIVTPIFDPSMEGERENPAETYEKVFALIGVSDAGVSVYLMKEELIPHKSFSSTEGGSTLMSEITDAYGQAAAEVSYMLYAPSQGGYVKTSESDIAVLDGELRGYALNMGDTALIYVHPLSVVLLIKQDPGEYATLVGMISAMAGAVLMCLLRGKGKGGRHGDFDVAPAKSAPVKTPSAKSSPTKKATSAKPTAQRSPSPHSRSKGGKK